MNYPIMKLKDCCTIIAGQSPESKYYNTDGSGIPFFQGKSDFGELYPSIRVYCSQPTKIAEKNDILLSVRAPVGPTNLAPCRICIGRGLTAIRPGDQLLTRYVLLFFRYFEAILAAKGTGTTFKAITQDVVKNLEIPIPPLSEQHRIVSRIKELFSQLDVGVDTLRKVQEQLTVYRQAVLKQAFSICNERVTIASITQHVTDGDHMPPPKADTGVPFIMISNVKDNVICWENTAFVGRDYFDGIDAKRKPQKGDILYTVTGSYGIPVLVDYEKEFCFQRHIALLRPKDLITQKYLYYALMEPGTYTQATKGATGTAQKTVGLGILRKMTIPFTTEICEQDEIVSDIEKKLSVCDSIEKTVDNALTQLKSMRHSILKQAFEGRL